ncbi:hypothetical protein [Allorhodopirellula heiligendammensis]|uniref:Uncharacterized protein n=1 Tax=Allorhodopirellula heiligendammensis TaxID=2714739 RepID=A0A5C6BXF8_9BACT|nr:hypothetical protein [Allorhodopirellula heiligendammensis]TWU16502.1 hypothetical protein Poly21_37070 [Allorhodopirellula heiligendammensis]|tara:strand:+ start:343 stop:666 length:324 start_codon:yes stop_codon:yes gene_type:complete
MNRSFITYYRGNKQLHTSKLNGFPFVSFGDPVGEVNGATWFNSVTITIGGNRERVVTSKDFDGPVAICFETCGQPPRWFGLADTTPTHLSTKETGRRQETYAQETSA